MKPEDILALPAKILTRDQRESYFETGYLMIERLIPESVIDELNRITATFIEQSRALTASDDEIDIGPGHTAETPIVRRLKSPDKSHDAYWQLATGVIADVTTDLLGPDVYFHHSKLNFKWGGGTDEVKWHQDFPFYPHTNANVLAVGTYLADVGEDDGPLAVIPGSHKTQIHEQFDERGMWTGAMRDADVALYDIDSTVYMPGPRGSITIHHSRTVHSTKPTTKAASGRPLLINAYAAADAFPYSSPKNTYTPHGRTLVRGQPAKWAHLDPDPCPVPPDWSAGYTSIYAQQGDQDRGPTPRDPGIRPDRRGN
jgi:ectoine hydroxylase